MVEKYGGMQIFIMYPFEDAVSGFDKESLPSLFTPIKVYFLVIENDGIFEKSTFRA